MKNLPKQTWRDFPIAQQPMWPCRIELQNATDSIRNLPPLVSPIEVLRLRKELASVAKDGTGFVLQGGDCAERFSDCRPEMIESKIRVLLQMAGVLRHTTGERCVVIARIAGQYGKPRSSNPKTEDPKQIFRGDNIHGFDVSERRQNPQRLIEGYFRSSATLNYVRTLLKDGFEDIPNFPPSWNMQFLNVNLAQSLETQTKMLVQVTNNAHNYRLLKNSDDEKATVHISHEALLLDYEDAMTREIDGKYYNLSAPFIWIGDRTRQLDHAHIEYVSHIENPVGIKVGPTMEPEELLMLLKLIWPQPERSPGKVTLITRYGASKVEQLLPRHIEAVQAAGYKVVWSCDPCHGNTRLCPENGYKTREFGDILTEIRKCFEIHRAYGSRLGGIHIECTGEEVTECVGGCENLTDSDIPLKFESYCDPRLNYVQSMELSLLLGSILSQDKNSTQTQFLQES